MKLSLLFFFSSCILFSAFASDPELDQIKNSLANRSSGAFIRITPQGNIRLFSVGTAAYDGSISNRDRLRLEKDAARAARTELSRFMKEELSSAEKCKEAFQEAVNASEKNGKVVKSSQVSTAEEVVSEINRSSSALIRGIVTIHSIDQKSENGGFIKVLVGTSTGTMAAQDHLTGNVPAPAPNPPAAVPQNPQAAAQPPAPAEAGPGSANGLTCIGKGGDRNAAVMAALLEGIRQVYGTSIQNDEVYKTRFSKLIQNGAASSSDQEQSDASTISKTWGFVREYRIIQVVQINDAQLQATVKAWIVNPRSGGIRTMALYPMKAPVDKVSSEYCVGPKRYLSGADFSRSCQLHFERAFNRTNKFIILNKADMQKALQEQQFIAQAAAANVIDPGEMSKLGQVLAADYIFSASFPDIRFSRKLSYNPATKKFGPVYSMKISFSFKIINVKTAEIAVTDYISVSLTSKEISDILSEEGNEDQLLEQLFKKVIAEIIKKGNL